MLRYWWVNQNQTYRHEVGGGYLWSPKRNRDGRRNAFYESMRELAPGDVIFSFCDTRIAALGIARSFCYESPKPPEFGIAGANWDRIGWRADVQFRELQNRIRPKDHMSVLAPLLPEKYAPLRRSGDGLQGVYLVEIPVALAWALQRLVGREALGIADAATRAGRVESETPSAQPVLVEWERREIARIEADPVLGETERSALIRARRGQGLFRERVMSVERACRITRVDRPEHLIASHSKPWRNCSNDERLDAENGLVLTPTADHLFDKGFISFEDKGKVIVSPVADAMSLRRMGIDPGDPPNVGAFSEGQRHYLGYHRENVLRKRTTR
jgi:hypothetical protein